MVKPLWEAAHLKYLHDHNWKPDGKTVLSPCPGWGVGTPWGAKPKNNTYWQTRGHHTGDDYPGDQGDKVVAILAGTVHYRWDIYLGNVVLLYASNGYTYWYCHLSRRTARDGQHVDKQDKLGEVGQTGLGAPFGPHLHFEKREGHTSSWAGRDLKPTWP